MLEMWRQLHCRTYESVYGKTSVRKLGTLLRFADSKFLLCQHGDKIKEVQYSFPRDRVTNLKLDKYKHNSSNKKTKEKKKR